jgi:hypothetical protein
MPSSSPESSDTGTEHLELLYRARINIPKACEIAGMPACEKSWGEMKSQFREWLKVYNSV